MLKKIVIGLVSVGTLAVLIVGGVNRTIAKTSDEYGTGERSGGGQKSLSGIANDLHTQYLGGNGSKAGSGGGQNSRSENAVGVSPRNAIDADGTGQGRRAGGGRQAETGGEPLVLAEEQFSELVTLQGSITGVNLAEAVLINTESGAIVLEGRALSFAVSQGFTAQEGDVVLVSGFYEGEDFEIVQLNNQTSQQIIQLREPSGRPLWAGGGRAS